MVQVWGLQIRARVTTTTGGGGSTPTRRVNGPRPRGGSSPTRRVNGQGRTPRLSPVSGTASCPLRSTRIGCWQISDARARTSGECSVALNSSTCTRGRGGWVGAWGARLRRVQRRAEQQHLHMARAWGRGSGEVEEVAMGNSRGCGSAAARHRAERSVEERAPCTVPAEAQRRIVHRRAWGSGARREPPPAGQGGAGWERKGAPASVLCRCRPWGGAGTSS
jgi:hypothetical protein